MSTGRKRGPCARTILEALKRLKGELGREENLKAATQVLAEIEAVEDGEEAEDLPEDADYRFKRIRKKWDEGLEDILDERKRKTAKTAELYLKALDAEKRKLTRANQIKAGARIRRGGESGGRAAGDQSRNRNRDCRG